MQPYWLRFPDGSEACCEGPSVADAVLIAEKLTGKKVAEDRFGHFAFALPYAAQPIIWQFDHPVHGKAPTLCGMPRECAKTGRCMRELACSS